MDMVKGVPMEEAMEEGEKGAPPDGTPDGGDMPSLNPQPSRKPVIFKAVLYMLGIATTYTTLGVVVTAFV